MTPEQMETAIEFILNEQARITTKFEMWTDEFQQELKEMRESQAELRAAQLRTDVQIRALREAQAETDTQLRALGKTQAEGFQYLSKQQARTSGELETFMNAMTQFVTEVRHKR